MLVTYLIINKHSVKRKMNKIRTLFSQISSGEKPDFVTWCFPVIGLLILCLIPLMLNRESIENADNITIAAIAGPVIALIAALLTFLAFWAQVQSNKANKIVALNTVQADPAVCFENKFYELLKIHRANVAEININDKVFGRNAFISMFSEFKFCYLILRSVYTTQHELKSGNSILSEQDFMNISYIVFFMGINGPSGDLVQGLIKQYDEKLIEKYISMLKKLQKKHSEDGQLFTQAGETIYGIKLKYKPFSGHMSRLEHYYRHLFQSVKFIVEYDDNSGKEKYEFLKLLRVQLSGHEQLMLYYNSLTTLGRPWIENKYFTEYRMLKNLPLPLADFGEKPKDKLGERNSKGEMLFEWDEISFRNKAFHPGSSFSKPLNGK